MASVSLYVAIRSKVGQGHEVNHTNVFLDGTCQDPARMTAGYENQFSCRKGCFGICEGTQEGIQGSETAKALLESVGETDTGDWDKLVHSLEALPENKSINLSLLFVQDGALSLGGMGEMPLYLLRNHRLRQLTPADNAEDRRLQRNAVCLENKDRLLLCTKELINSIEPAMLQTILDERGEPDQVAGDLVQEAIKNGAKRDVTAIVVVCDAVEELMAEPYLEEESTGEQTAPQVMGLAAAWYRNKRVVGAVSAICVCLLAVAGVTLASILGKRGATPVDASKPSPPVTVSETSGLLTQPESTQAETTEAEPAQTERTRERTTVRRTTTTKRKAPATNASEKSSTENPSVPSSTQPHAETSEPSRPLEE